MEISGLFSKLNSQEDLRKIFTVVLEMSWQSMKVLKIISSTICLKMRKSYKIIMRENAEQVAKVLKNR